MENKEIAIKIDHLTKIYKMYDAPIDRMKEALNPFHKRYSTDFYALEDLSLTIYKGETMGFLGKNGAGKSTLLKLITGVLSPSSGSVEVHGRIASLLELGAGFNPEMTGIENIYMNGMLMGYSRKDMESRVPAIIEFADIGGFINQPVKTYSSGMFARLAFSVNAFVEPDILIVDEALSVGDAFFQAKCIDQMKRMMKSGITVLFVSHDIGAVKSICERAALLVKGRLMQEGPASEVVEEYNNMQLASGVLVSRSGGKTRTSSNFYSSVNKAVCNPGPLFLKNASYQRIQDGRAEFLNVELLDEDGKPLVQAAFGQDVVLRMVVAFQSTIPLAGVGYAIRSAAGVDLVYGDSRLDNNILKDVQPGDQYLIDWHFTAGLQAGSYSIVCAISELKPVIGYARCDFIPCAVQFTVAATDVTMGGYVHWQNQLEVRKI